MMVSYCRVEVEIEKHDCLEEMDRLQAASNIRIAACIADGPFGKVGLLSSLRHYGVARGIVLKKNVRTFERRLKLSGVTCNLTVFPPFTTNHGKRPINGDRWSPP